MGAKKEMTVAEIKETLDGFGIEYDNKLKKAELLAILEAETVEGLEIEEANETETIGEPEKEPEKPEEPKKQYVVIRDFKDLKDKGKIYIKGDPYPRPINMEVSEERIKELSSTKNKQGKVLIEERS